MRFSTVRRRGLARVASLALLTLPILFSLLASRPAMAQGNYRSSPMGGRTTLLGGTGVVYGMDGAAVFMNPATVLNIDSGRLSFSVNFYAVTFTNSSHWYQPGAIDRSKFGDLEGGKASMSDVNLSALPSSLCLFFKVGALPFLGPKAKLDEHIRDARLGLCFATTQTEQFDFAAENYERKTATGTVSRQAQTISQRFSRFQFGPTYAMWLSERLSLGASIHASIASHRSSLEAMAFSSSPTSARPIQSMFFSSSHGTSFQLHATAGANYRYRNQTFGVAVEAPSLHLSGSGGASMYTHTEGAASETSSLTGDGNFVSRTPLRVSVGTGVAGKWGSAELDASYYAPMSSAFNADVVGQRVDIRDGQTVSTPQSLALSQASRGVVNVGVGAEVYVSQRLSILGGISTDVSAVGGGQLKGVLFNYFPAKTNRIAASFGIGSHGEGGDLLLGTELSLGFGDRLAVNSYQVPPVLDTAGHSTFGVLFVIAGSASVRNLVRAVKDVQKVFTEPSGTTPTEKPEKPGDPGAPAPTSTPKPGSTNPSAPNKDFDKLPLPKF